MRDFKIFEREIEDSKRRMARARRTNEIMAWVLGTAISVAIIGVVVFACWCVYHVLKGKGLLP